MEVVNKNVFMKVMRSSGVNVKKDMYCQTTNSTAHVSMTIL